jgi:hypothetical protein
VANIFSNFSKTSKWHLRITGGRGDDYSVKKTWNKKSRDIAPLIKNKRRLTLWILIYSMACSEPHGLLADSSLRNHHHDNHWIRQHHTQDITGTALRHSLCYHRLEIVSIYNFIPVDNKFCWAVFWSLKFEKCYNWKNWKSISSGIDLAECVVNEI